MRKRIGAAAGELGAGGVQILEPGVDEAPVGGVTKALAESLGAAQTEPQDGDPAIGEELQEGVELLPGRRQGVVLDPDQRRRQSAPAPWPPELGGYRRYRRHWRRACDPQLDRQSDRRDRSPPMPAPGRRRAAARRRPGRGGRRTASRAETGRWRLHRARRPSRPAGRARASRVPTGRGSGPSFLAGCGIEQGGLDGAAAAPLQCVDGCRPDWRRGAAPRNPGAPGASGRHCRDRGSRAAACRRHRPRRGRGVCRRRRTAGAGTGHRDRAARGAGFRRVARSCNRTSVRVGVELADEGDAIAARRDRCDPEAVRRDEEGLRRRRRELEARRERPGREELRDAGESTRSAGWRESHASSKRAGLKRRRWDASRRAPASLRQPAKAITAAAQQQHSRPYPACRYTALMSDRKYKQSGYQDSGSSSRDSSRRDGDRPSGAPRASGGAQGCARRAARSRPRRPDGERVSLRELRRAPEPRRRRGPGVAVHGLRRRSAHLHPLRPLRSRSGGPVPPAAEWRWSRRSPRRTAARSSSPGSARSSPPRSRRPPPKIRGPLSTLSSR